MTEPVPVRDAATVVLVRDGADGLEAWLLTRVRAMVFAAGMSVFPGGRVEETDASLPMPPGAADATAAAYGCSNELARALLGAAVRETFEETGVLLASRTVDLSASRADVEAGRVAFGSLLDREGLVLETDGLRPWSRWITPEGEKRRYDTRFFVAALPSGAVASDVTSEASTASWVPVSLALEQARRGERGLLPPTLVTLSTIESCGSVAAVLAASDGRSMDPIEPSIRRSDDSIFADLPDGTSVELPVSMFR